MTVAVDELIIDIILSYFIVLEATSIVSGRPAQQLELIFFRCPILNELIVACYLPASAFFYSC